MLQVWCLVLFRFLCFGWIVWVLFLCFFLILFPPPPTLISILGEITLPIFFFLQVDNLKQPHAAGAASRQVLPGRTVTEGHPAFFSPSSLRVHPSPLPSLRVWNSELVLPISEVLIPTVWGGTQSACKVLLSNPSEKGNNKAKANEKGTK